MTLLVQGQDLWVVVKVANIVKVAQKQDFTFLELFLSPEKILLNARKLEKVSETDRWEASIRGVVTYWARGQLSPRVTSRQPRAAKQDPHSATRIRNRHVSDVSQMHRRRHLQAL